MRTAPSSLTTSMSRQLLSVSPAAQSELVWPASFAVRLTESDLGGQLRLGHLCRLQRLIRPHQRRKRRHLLRRKEKSQLHFLQVAEILGGLLDIGATRETRS